MVLEKKQVIKAQPVSEEEVVEEVEQPKVNLPRQVANVELVDVVTQTAPAFKLPSGETVGLNEYLVWLGNLVYKLTKAVTG